MHHDVHSSSRQKSSSVLPAMCIICKKADKFITVKHKRQKEKLTLTETESAGRLCEAARLKADETILMHTRDQDCVAIEVRYHKSCYKEYTRFLQKHKEQKASDVPLPYAKAYKIFCDMVIETRLIRNQEILRMNRLHQLFVSTVKKKEGLDCSHYRKDKLKKRLQHDFPQLKFVAPRRKNLSEMVFVEPGALVDRIPSSSETESPDNESSESQGNDYDTGAWEVETGSVSAAVGIDLEKTRTLFNSGTVLHHAVKDMPGMKAPWPPTSENLTVSEARSIVPVELYNFLAWVVGASEEPTLSSFVETTEETDLKLLSLCQDIIYLASKGRNQTPKSLCLGLTVRHLTGSSQLISLLNKLGNCASCDTVVGFETSLAQLQLSASSEVPPGFSKNTPTVLVWDNIDFGEETGSGHGTTHHTNGIMVQARVQESVQPRGVQIKKGVRSLKPTVAPLEFFHQAKKHGPPKLGIESQLDKSQFLPKVSEAKAIDMGFILCKVSESGLGNVPGWTGFNIALQKQVPLSKSAIHYLPVIEASPTEMSTVYTILQRSIEISQQLEVEHIVLVFDQAIYAKAQQIRWNDEAIRNRVIIRLGEFHTCMSFLGVLGKRFGDAGLQDILIESEIVAQGSIKGVMSGHHYNRSIRAHKIVYEALERLRFASFLDSLGEQEHSAVLGLVSDVRRAYPSAFFQDITSSEQFSQMMDRYEKFVEEKSSQDPTFSVWSSYIEMVQTLLIFVRATRTSDWDMHLSAIRFMLPWYFAYSRMNYARYLPAYWLEMINLPDTHPECHKQLSSQGQWTVQRQDRHSFASIACDQAIEQTCNRDTKTSGGLTGITLNRGAVQRWILAQPQRAAITRRCEEMAGKSLSPRIPKELDASRIANHEVSVQSVINTLESMMNPFESRSHEQLVCLSSGVVAPSDVAADYASAKEKGENALSEFMKERLFSNDVDIFAPIKSLRLKTFGDRKSRREVTVKNDRKLFARILAIGQTRKVDLREVLTYSLGSVSFPLASSDLSLAKTTKSALMEAIESTSVECCVDNVPANSALVIDGMALVQSMSDIPSTFGELADAIFANIIHLATRNKCTRVDFITDRYPSISIKNPERSRRAGGSSELIHIHGKDQKTPRQWKKFLSNGSNKESLIEFLFQCWKSVSLSGAKHVHEVYVAHGEVCHKLEHQGETTVVCQVSELSCDHEEADTRLLLHAKHASLSFPSVVIRSPDTDVEVIALSMKPQIGANLYFMTGVKNRARIVDLGKIAGTLGQRLSESLIGLHVFTGCDSTSAFYGKGKKKALSLVKENEHFRDAFVELGDGFDLKDSTLTVLEEFVCQLYGQKTGSINEARYKLFCTSTVTEQSLPPTKDALAMHSKRANYQAAIHRKALDPFIRAPDPGNHGWVVSKEELSIKWMSQPSAPEALLELASCGCKAGKCSKGRCSCLKAELKCTDLCKCTHCENRVTTAEEEDVVDDLGDDSEDDSDE